MSETRDLPIALTGRRVLVVGGGTPALGAISRLLRAGARVEVVAPRLETAVQDLWERGHVVWHERGYTPEDLDEAWLVAALSGDAALDAVVLADAESARVPTLLTPRPGASESAEVRPGRVVLVGGGPGDPGLITVAGREAVRAADVVVVDRLAPLALLDELGPEVEIIDVSKIPRGRYTPQEEINDVLVDRARRGKRVVRLKGGDPFVFGRGMEEWLACVSAGVEVSALPGVTSAVAGPGLAGIPVTHRGLVQGFAVVSGHVAPDDPRSTVDWDALGRTGMTIVVLMGVHTLLDIARALLAAGRTEGTPVAAIMDAALPSQRVVATTLGGLPETIDQISAPAVTVVGDVASFAG